MFKSTGYFWPKILGIFDQKYYVFLIKSTRYFVARPEGGGARGWRGRGPASGTSGGARRYRTFRRHSFTLPDGRNQRRVQEETRVLKVTARNSTPIVWALATASQLRDVSTAIQSAEWSFGAAFGRS